MKKIWKVRNKLNVALKTLYQFVVHTLQNIQRYSASDQIFFHSLELRQRAEEVANLEKELRALQITAERLMEKKNQNQKHLEQTEGRLQKQQEGKHKHY